VKILKVKYGLQTKMMMMMLMKLLFRYAGMQPLLYSSRGSSWKRVGRNISYQRNIANLQCPLLARDCSYYVLQWQMVSIVQYYSVNGYHQ